MIGAVEVAAAVDADADADDDGREKAADDGHVLSQGPRRGRTLSCLLERERQPRLSPQGYGRNCHTLELLLQMQQQQQQQQKQPP